MKHDTDAPWAAPPQPGQQMRRESTRPAVKEDLLVPLGWLAQGAVLVCLLAFIGALLLRSATEWRIMECVGVAVALGLLFWLVMWFVFTHLLWGGLNFISTVETVTGWDVNRDGHIGQPPVERFEVWRKTSEPSGGQHWDVFQPPGTKANFAQLCIAALEDRSLTQGVWVGTDKPYKRKDFDPLIDQLVAKGWLEWINPDHHQAGLRVTDDGRYEMTQWLRQYGTMLAGADRMVIDAEHTTLPG